MIIESTDVIKNPEVSVIVLTYNHECYITQCIEAILSQKVNFSYEIIISDDYSQDNTPEICKKYQLKYPQKIRLLLQEKNRGIAHNYGDTIALTRGKYISQVAGDDFWILDTKLQLQKDYLDTHTQCGLCYTNINICDENSAIFEKHFLKKENLSKSFTEHLLSKGFIAPMTWMFRREYVEIYDINGAYTDESFGFALDIFATTRVDYLDVVSTNYRMIMGTLSRPTSEQKWYRQYLGVFRAQQYYCDKYNISSDICRRVYLNGYIELLPYAIVCEDLVFKEEMILYCNKIGYDIMTYIKICEEKIRIEKELCNIKKSYAYRLGKFILQPIIFFKNGN